jgi:hypothetical protein
MTALFRAPQSQHRQWFLRLGWWKFPIEISEFFFGQFDLDRLRVIADMLFRARFRNGYDSTLTQHACKCAYRRTGISMKLSLNHSIFNGSLASAMVSSLMSLPVP